MGNAAKHNILILTIDAWRADFVSSFAGISLTPNLQQLARHTASCQQAYTSGPWTTPSIVSLFTGQDALSHGVCFSWSSLHDNPQALPSCLAAAGYRVYNFCYKTASCNYQDLGFAPEHAPSYPSGPEDSFLPEILARLTERDEKMPWLGWYHYKYVHLPYWPTVEFRRLFLSDDVQVPSHLIETVGKMTTIPRGSYDFHPHDRDIIQRLYAANVRMMDGFLGRVIESLRASGQLETTTIVITSDHGDEHLEHGHLGHASTARHATLHEEVLRIPLLIIDTRINGPHEIQELVQIQDLMPTLLSLAGVAAPITCLDAVDFSPLLFESSRGDTVSPRPSLTSSRGSQRPVRFHSSRMGFQTERRHAHQSIVGFREGAMKYIVERFDSEQRWLFDLDVDPLEQNPRQSGSAVHQAHQRLMELSRGSNTTHADLHEQGPWRRLSRLHGWIHRSRGIGS